MCGGASRHCADRLSKAEISPQQAATAADDRKKGTVTGVSLEDSDDGATIWSVDVVTTNDWYKTTFDVDAANGKALRQKVDRDLSVSGVVFPPWHDRAVIASQRRQPAIKLLTTFGASCSESGNALAEWRKQP
ncbi:PepSY domain-containing protein [Streptomyces halobius]|uniref:PepSY domain-containing protein n=1 Tax=Streptomyces halobius TaxID=2879846 RepID=A0ABY4ML45_9ACTN|nr:PepSY domain-containing protein [Streptomyces halobius]UQA97150.1 PepSY domain-containing protein [Streptomyces halobius]